MKQIKIITIDKDGIKREWLRFETDEPAFDGTGYVVAARVADESVVDAYWDYVEDGE
jgi:hypothetical protein